MLQPSSLPALPDDTARVVRAAFPAGHPYLTLADELSTLFTDKQFTALFPTHGQPALAPWHLALVSILQFAEGLSDRQAAHAVRSRLDWKYVLRLELADAGFDASVLSEFRTRLIVGGSEQLLFDTLLIWCRERQLLKAHGHQRTDSTHILAAVRALNRIEVVAETMRHTLDSLAVAAPSWLQAHAASAWTERYARRAEEGRLPAGKDARAELARTIGADGYLLFAPSMRPTRQVGCAKCLRWRRCAASGCKISPWRTTTSRGARMPWVSHPQRSFSARPTTWTPIWGRRTRRAGSATRWH